MDLVNFKVKMEVFLPELNAGAVKQPSGVVLTYLWFRIRYRFSCFGLFCINAISGKPQGKVK